MLSAKGMSPAFASEAGTHPGTETPRCRNVEAVAAATNTETMPFQNNPKKSSPNTLPRERLVAPATMLAPSRRNQAPAGGLLRSTVSSTAVPEVRADRQCERLHFRQYAMSLATLMSSPGMTPLQEGQIGATEEAMTNFSSVCI